MKVQELMDALLALPSEMKHLPVVLIDETQGIPITFQIHSLRPWKAGRRAPISCIVLSEERTKAKP